MAGTGGRFAVDFHSSGIPSASREDHPSRICDGQSTSCTSKRPRELLYLSTSTRSKCRASIERSECASRTCTYPEVVQPSSEMGMGPLESSAKCDTTLSEKARTERSQH